MKHKLLFLLASFLISLTSFAQVVANQPPDLEACDDDLDQFYDWDLSVQNDIILGGQDPATFLVTYHISQQDADNGINSLANPFTNTVNPQTIYATVSDITTGVNATTSFNLIVNTIPVNAFATDVITCSGAQPGFGVFDLTLNVFDYTQGNPSLEVTYFEDLNDAFNNINQISNPNTYENITAYTQAIYLRVTDLNTGCFYVSSESVLYLNVEDLPFVNTPTPLTACDGDGDGIAAFNLTDKDAEIIAGPTGNTDYIVSYHQTQSDADTNISPLVSPYTNISNPEIVYVRVTGFSGDCYQTTTLELVVETNCFAIYPAELFACDDTGNGVSDFFLPDANVQVLGNLDPALYTVAYYLTTDDAINDLNPLPDTYTSTQQTVIVKVIDNASGDYELTTLGLNVQPLPTIGFNSSYDICDGDSVTLVVGAQTTGVYVAEWSLDGIILAGETTFALTVNTSGVYSVTVTETNSGCTSTASTVVNIGNTVNLVAPADMFECNDTAASTFFDLTAQNDIVLAGLDPANYPISFYASQQDAITPQNPITNASNYEVFSSQIIFMRVDNPTGVCPSIFAFQLNIDSCPITVDCTAVSVNTVFCYSNGADNLYVFTSSDGNPLSVFFNSGFVEDTWDELIVLDSDGVTNLNAATPYGNAGDVSGLVFVSSGDTLTIIVEEDTVFSCETEGYQPLNFDVACVDTTALPNCNASLTSPVNGDTNVNENSLITWSAASVLVDGYTISIGTTPGGTDIENATDLGNVLSYQAALGFDTTYYVTLVPYNGNGDATGCTEESFTTRLDPNQPLDCASGQSINNTFCYVNSDTTQYSYVSNDGSPLLIIFNSGFVEDTWDELIILDSDGVTNLNADNPYGNNGDLTGLQFLTTGDSVTIYVQSDGSISCESSGYTQIDYDVFCGSNVGFIQVNSFLDYNNNGIQDGTDLPFTNGYFTYDVNDAGNPDTVVTNTGSFTLNNTDDTNSYDFTFNVNPGYENCFSLPTSLIENITVANGTTTVVDFPVTEVSVCEDIAVYLIPMFGPRPGFDYYHLLEFENLGSSTVSGSIEFVNDPLVTYLGVTNVPVGATVTTTATGFILDFVNLLPGQVESLYIDLNCPATVSLGTLVTSTATYTSAVNDIMPNNNTSSLTEEVIGSYDPNDITETHGKDIVYEGFITTDEYLYYRVRFQNVGTADAINVKIENTLNPLLDFSTMHMLRSSHDFMMMQDDAQLTWQFDNINLPAQQDDDLGSNGFVLYRIKPLPGYNIGTQIPNTAEIYFDFNAPVITNTFTTTFVEPALSVDQFIINGFNLYPNPATTDVTIRFSNALRGSFALTVIDIQGKQVLSSTVNTDTTSTFNVSALESGMYFVKLNNNTTEHIQKLIVK